MPGALARLNRRAAPHGALVAGVVALLTGHTDQLIVLAVLGALVMNAVSLISLFVLRRREPNLARPFLALGYPVVPAVALLLVVLGLGAIVYSNLLLSGVFVVGILAGSVVGWAAGGNGNAGQLST